MAANKCLLVLEGEMAVAAAVAQFVSGNMTLGVSRFDQLC